MILFGLSLFAIAGLVSAYRALTRPVGNARVAGHRGGWRLAAFLERAGVRGQAAPGAFVALSLGTAAAGGLACYLLLDWALLALVGAGVGLVAPGLYFERGAGGASAARCRPPWSTPSASCARDRPGQSVQQAPRRAGADRPAPAAP